MIDIPPPPDPPFDIETFEPIKHLGKPSAGEFRTMTRPAQAGCFDRHAPPWHAGSKSCSKTAASSCAIPAEALANKSTSRSRTAAKRICRKRLAMRQGTAHSRTARFEMNPSTKTPVPRSRAASAALFAIPISSAPRSPTPDHPWRGAVKSKFPAVNQFFAVNET